MTFWGSLFSEVPSMSWISMPEIGKDVLIIKIILSPASSRFFQDPKDKTSRNQQRTQWLSADNHGRPGFIIFLMIRIMIRILTMCGGNHVSPMAEQHEEPALVRSCLVVGEQLIGASADVGIGPITWRNPPMDTRKGMVWIWMLHQVVKDWQSHQSMPTSSKIRGGRMS